MPVFATPEFNRAVIRFKSLFGEHHELYEWGQFYVTNSIARYILRTIERELRDSVGFRLILVSEGEAGVRARLQPTLSYFRAMLARPSIPVGFIVSDIIPNMERRENTTFPAIRALFPLGSPTQDDTSEVKGTFERLWNHQDIPTGAPYLGQPTVKQLMAAYSLERDKCFTVSRRMARMILAKQKITILDPKLRISLGTIPGVVVKDGQYGPNRRERQQIIVYGNQTRLKAIIAQMQTILSPPARGLVQLGVLSGVRQDKNLFQQPEHYVLAFEYGKVDGLDALLCWDPDASRSNIEASSWGPGFACLLYESDRLSTAYSVQDLNAINMDKDQAEYGDHLNDRRRHCYQVYYLQTLPL